VRAALLIAALLPTGGNAFGQQRPLAEQIVGTWTYVSVDTIRPDGSRVPMFGPSPRGTASFDAAGHYILMTARADQRAFASNNRTEATADEAMAVVQGTIAHFGRYVVDEAAGTITFSIDASTFPNWNGAVQRRPFTIRGDELRWRTAASSGGSAEVVLKRAN
jgi:hypothetical protein